MNEPFLKEAERLGFRDLVNIATLKIRFCGTASLPGKPQSKPGGRC
jgi:hypothetical protein